MTIERPMFPPRAESVDSFPLQPTTLAGVLAVLRFANQFEAEGNEWPDSDRIGPDGWHYQLRGTMAAAIETITRVQS